MILRLPKFGEVWSDSIREVEVGKNCYYYFSHDRSSKYSYPFSSSVCYLFRQGFKLIKEKL